MLVLVNTTSGLSAPNKCAATPDLTNNLALFGNKPGQINSFRSIYTQRFQREPMVFFVGETMFA